MQLIATCILVFLLECIKIVFVLLEEWATQEDLERHIRTDNQRMILALMDLLVEMPDLRFNTVSHTAGMDLIENVLKADLRDDKAILIKGGVSR